MNPVLDELKVFTGNGHPELAKSVCKYLDIPLGEAEVFKFANDNTFVRIKENIRQRDVFIVQPTCYPVNDNLMELLIMIDACKRASAGRITAVIPYYGYGRTDKKDQPRVPITARLVADLLTAAGADRMLTVDLHAGQIQGFFNIPVDELTALPILTDYFKEKEINDLVVVAVDIGISKKARDVADRLQVTDKKDQPRVPITARLVADLLTAAGADRMLTVDLHAGQIQGFFNIPVDELTALPILTDYFKEKEINDLVVVAVDIGISKKARDVADRLHAPLAIIEKRRIGNDEHTEMMNVIGDVRGKVALTFDDEIATGGTIVNAAQALAEHGVKEVYCCVTHPILSGNAPQLMAESNFTEVVVSDTIPVSPEKRNGKITVLSVAPLLGEAIYRIHKGLSVGDMFNA